MKCRTPDQLVSDVGHRLRELRTSQGLTQQRFAEQLGISVQYYRRVESGQVNVSVRTLAELSQVLGVEPAALLERPHLRVKPRRGRPKKARQLAERTDPKAKGQQSRTEPRTS